MSLCCWQLFPWKLRPGQHKHQHIIICYIFPSFISIILSLLIPASFKSLIINIHQYTAHIDLERVKHDWNKNGQGLRPRVNLAHSCTRFPWYLGMQINAKTQ